MNLKEFVRKFGEPYSHLLGIDLKSGKNGEIVKWFLASILYGKPIRESSATKTYKVFERRGVVTVSKILQTRWRGLVSILDEGAYTRYDFSTADRLLEIFGNLRKEYRGNLNHLHASALDSIDLEEKLMNLGRGIGPTTISIFLREMRPVWDKANPAPSPLVRRAMEELGINQDLVEFAKENQVNIVRLETALLRLGKDYINKGKRLDVDVNQKVQYLPPKKEPN